ncbi:amidohydrolase family protein [Pigmentiphaga soli]
MPLRIVDAQVHIWAPDNPKRPWPPEVRDRVHRPVPITAESLLAEMEEAGVERAVLVPPSWEGDRNDVCLAASRKYPDRYATMGRISLTDPESPARVARAHDEPGLLGFRFTFNTDRSRPWLVDGTADWLWPAAEKAGVPLMILPPGALGAVKRIVQRHPGLKLTIDHMAIVRANRDDAAFGHLDELLALARYPNVSVKATCLPEYSTEPYPFRGMHKYVQRVVETFGPERVFWGTDMSRSPISYRRNVTLFTEEMPFLDDRARRLIMGQAICDWLDWPL